MIKGTHSLAGSLIDSSCFLEQDFQDADVDNPISVASHSLQREDSMANQVECSTSAVNFHPWAMSADEAKAEATGLPDG